MKAKIPLDITQSQLKELLSYDSDTGRFTWLKPGRGIVVGRRTNEASNCNNGYVAVGLHGKKIYAHRLVWFYVNGEWPLVSIDHINQNKTDNRITNLRMTNKSENGQNRGPQANNKTGIKGVYSSSTSKKWVAQLHVGGKNIMVRSFDSPTDAANAYAAAAAQFHSCNPFAVGAI